MFKSLYDTPLVATLLPCIVALVVVLWAQTKKPFVRVYGSIFAVGIAADAWLNNAWTPVKSGSSLATAIMVFFVIFGDFRYFVVLEESLHNTHKILRAVGWAFIVPVVTQIVRWSIPRIENDERSTFLLYEILFFALAIFVRHVRAPRAKDATLATRASTFELVQYGTWIASDVGLVLTNADAFYLPRLAANLMYYVAFVPTMMKLLGSR